MVWAGEEGSAVSEEEVIVEASDVLRKLSSYRFLLWIYLI
jgi:hypothetical protein